MIDPLPSSAIPQADCIERALEYAVLLHYRQFALRDLVYRGRDAMYYRAAAQLLGLTDASGQPTATVVEFVHGGVDPLELLRASFERSAVGLAWARFGKGGLWSLDPDSAEAFLATATELAPATAERRAKTLRTWWHELAPEHSGPSVEQLRAELLARPLSSFHLSARTTNVFRRAGFELVHQVVALTSVGLLELRSFGQICLREVDGLLSQAPPGETIDELAAALSAGQVSWPAGFDTATATATATAAAPSPATVDPELIDLTQLSWNQLATTLPAHILALSIEQVDLPTRTYTFCDSEGIETIGQLVARSKAEVREARGVGPGTLARSLEQLLQTWQRYPTPAHLQTGTSADPAHSFDPSAFATVLELWEARLSHLPDRDAQVVLRRSGAVGEAETLEAISETLGVTRERVRQIEGRGLTRLRAEQSWMSRIRATLTAARGEASYLWLSDLEDDSFLQPLVDRPAFVRYLANRVIPDDWHAYAWDRDDVLLTHKREREPEVAYEELAAALRRTEWPAPYSSFLELVGAQLLADEADLRPLFIQRAQASLAVDNDDHPSEVLRFGHSRDARVLAYLTTREGPVSVRELHQLFGRGALPDECVIVARGHVALPRHFRDFELWERRLVPLAKRFMERAGPERQWMAHDLLELAGEEGRLPDWITPWLLSSMLRRSGEVEDLGRQRFALRGSVPQTRVHLVPAAVEILDRAGAPIPEDQLRARLGERVEVLDATFNTLRTSIPVFPLGDGRLGLIERDIPGGLDAIQLAGELLEVVLRQRGRGLSYHQALGELRQLSPEHAQWTTGMVAVVARARPTIIANRSGIGLDSWDGVRVPTQAELLLELLNAGEGVARVDAFLATLRELHGREPQRASIAGTANFVGARLRGEFVVLADLADDFIPPIERRRSQPEPTSEPSAATPAPSLSPAPAALALGHPSATALPPQFPSARDLALPRAARELYTKLTQELPGDWASLLARCHAHAAQFAALTQRNEFLPVNEARKLAAGLPLLVERAQASGDPVALRLAWVAARYFEIADDGELDFTIGGLDDDVAVFNAIVSHLGFAELAFDLT
ncbi:DNA-directed RNA polymerase subunit alpha C-terminal domain-containing protein [Enhygromyxa salina]|uniref:RNA polymerase sigma factor SigA n=1 Tax=Enhygromyxa salina TaxID=215803 RepID=A0A2S9XQW1_9BACT|nr:DNA-directed RNA polymerase subunit alpha C-terminal domain-containing protein [Enhygromyxa salina]PRP95253.1 RNA polymerase sigma factor SigA [Enhygromyxa salina]